MILLNWKCYFNRKKSGNKALKSGLLKTFGLILGFYTKYSARNSQYPHFMITHWNQKSRNLGTCCIPLLLLPSWGWQTPDIEIWKTNSFFSAAVSSSVKQTKQSWSVSVLFLDTYVTLYLVLEWMNWEIEFLYQTMLLSKNPGHYCYKSDHFWVRNVSWV